MLGVPAKDLCFLFGVPSETEASYLAQIGRLSCWKQPSCQSTGRFGQMASHMPIEFGCFGPARRWYESLVRCR